jgi:hypothetical protein
MHEEEMIAISVTELLLIDVCVVIKVENYHSSNRSYLNNILSGRSDVHHHAFLVCEM